MAQERIYKCATPAAMARRATGDLFSDMVMQLVYNDDPHEVVVEVDTNGRIDPVTKKQVVVIAVVPGHPTSQEVAQRIWDWIGWDELADDDWIDPTEVDVAAKGWDCRMKVRYP